MSDNRHSHLTDGFRRRCRMAHLVTASAAFCMMSSVPLFTSTAKSESAKSTILKVSAPLPAEHPSTKVLDFFKSEIETRSGGRITVRIFPNSQIGNVNDTIELARGGNIEILMASGIQFAPFRPIFNALGLPFLFRDREHMLAALEGPAGGRLRDELAGMQLEMLAVFDAGDRNFMTKRGPVVRPEDLAGMKIRVMPSQMMVDAVNALGASAVAMNQGEVYTALQTGVLDGWENNPPTAWNFKMHETGCIHYAETGHLMIPDFLVISTRAMRRLPEDLQAMVREVARETGKLQLRLWDEDVARSSAALRDAGMTFNTVNREAFFERVEKIYERAQAKFGEGFSRLVREIRETGGETP